MTFSKETSFNKDQLRNGVDIPLRKYGHKPSYRKMRYYSKNKNKPITGVVLSKDHTLLVSNSLQNRIKRDSFSVLKGGQLGIPELQSFKGRLQAAQIVNPRVFPELTKFTNAAMKSILATDTSNIVADNISNESSTNYELMRKSRGERVYE